MADRIRRARMAVRGRGPDRFRKALLTARFALRPGGFSLRFSTRDPDGRARQAEASRALRAWRDGEKMVGLEGGGFAELPLAWLERHGRQVADLLAASADGEELPRALLPDLAALCESLDLPPPADAAGAGFGRTGGGGSSARDAVAGSTAAAASAAASTGCAAGDAGLGALLADDMGLGKTIQRCAR